MTAVKMVRYGQIQTHCTLQYFSLLFSAISPSKTTASFQETLRSRWWKYCKWLPLSCLFSLFLLKYGKCYCLLDSIITVLQNFLYIYVFEIFRRHLALHCNRLPSCLYLPLARVTSKYYLMCSPLTHHRLCFPISRQ